MKGAIDIFGTVLVGRSSLYVSCETQRSRLTLTSRNMLVAYAAASAGSISSKAIDTGFASVGPNVN